MKRILLALCVSLALACTAWPQESRGSITGLVTDPQGAVIPGANVTITNTETNITSRTTTNQTGYFEVSMLNPGMYSVTAEATGFKKTVRTNIQLSVAGRLDLRFQLEVGQLAEVIEVTAEAPLLETTSASGGRVVDKKQILELPFSDMNPFALATIAPGMQWTGQPEYRRPFDNGGTSSFNTGGAAGTSNEYSIDGMPVAGTGNRVGFVPSSEAVQEFKLETMSFDASLGHTAGAVVNVMTNSGTNTVHGSLFDQHWQQRWNATKHVERLLWEQNVASGKIPKNTPKQATGRSNDFGGDIGGPIFFPKLFNGKDKAFFYFQYNGIYQKKAETTSSVNRTVPKMAWRTGDFSDLLAIDAIKHTIYDPRSARREGSRVIRTPFPENKGIPILNPVYKTYLDFYPAPNNPAIATAEGRSNYYAAQMPKDERFNSILNRYDINISEKQRLYGRWYWNHRLADEYDWTYETMRGLHANGLTRINKGGGGDWIYTFNSNNVLDLGVSWTRFNEGSQNSVQTSYKPSDVGLPQYMDEKAGGWTTLPRIQFDDIEDVSGGYPAIGTRGTTAELKVQMSTVTGNHSFKYGWQERRYYRTTAGPGDSSGNFQFGDQYMKQMDNTNTQDRLALSWASFMIGLPSNGISIASNDTGYWGNRYRAFYLQDDWRITNRFRMNLGLRYERDGGVSERFNRALGGGFDFYYRPVFADAVEKVYRDNPLVPGLNNINIRGGVNYLGRDGHNTLNDSIDHLLPRIGVVYQITPKTVLRSGYGWYFDSRNVLNWTSSGPSSVGNQDGFSQGTSTVLTTDSGITFCCGTGAAAGLSATSNPMVDPFPVRPTVGNTRFDTAYRDSLGAMMRQGRGWDIFPRDYRPAAQQRWRIGIQREINANTVIEVSYNGAYSTIPVNDHRVNYLPEQYWWKQPVRNDAANANASDLQTKYPNPFRITNLTALQDKYPLEYAWMSTQGFFTGKDIQKNALLRMYPNMGSGNFRVDGGPDAQGGNHYHDVQIQFERRFSRGFQTTVLYTYAYGEEQDWWMNEYDQSPTWRPQNDIRPHRFVWTSIYQLPFGKGRRWVTSSPLQHIVGGWQLSWVYQYQNGSPVEWGNRIFYGDPEKDLPKILNSSESRQKDLRQWFDPSITWRGLLRPDGTYDTTVDPPAGFIGFEGRSGKQPASYTARIFPFHRSSWFRSDGIRNWDVKVKRNFQITERLKSSFDVDLLNATNHTNFEGPNTDPTSSNFGRVTTQRGLSRIIQLNLRIDF